MVILGGQLHKVRMPGRPKRSLLETLEATASLGCILFMETKFYLGSRGKKIDYLLMGNGKILKSIWGQKWCCGYFWK